MNISINNRPVRTIVAASALGIAFAGGLVTGRAADVMPQSPVVVAAAGTVPTVQHGYQIVGSRQDALEAERDEYVTAQERVLVGIVAPDRALHVIDDSAAGHMTAMEVVLVATGGR